jgi:hypothetical protein
LSQARVQAGRLGDGRGTQDGLVVGAQRGERVTGHVAVGEVFVAGEGVELGGRADHGGHVGGDAQSGACRCHPSP